MTDKPLSELPLRDLLVKATAGCIVTIMQAVIFVVVIVITFRLLGVDL